MNRWSWETRVIEIASDPRDDRKIEVMGNMVVLAAPWHKVQVLSDVTNRDGRTITLRARHRRMVDYLMMIHNSLTILGFTTKGIIAKDA